MPVVRLPDKLTTELNQSESGTIDNTEGPGVASYWASDRSVRVDIYIGLKLDGFKRYRNISAVKRSIKMQFVPQPIVSCQSEDVESFDPYEDKAIHSGVLGLIPIPVHLIHPSHSHLMDECIPIPVRIPRCSSQTFHDCNLRLQSWKKSAKNTLITPVHDDLLQCG